MEGVDTTIDISTISGVIANFGWKLIKQEITEKDIVLTIKKVISPAGEITHPPAD